MTSIKPKAIIVDEEDNSIGLKDRNEIDYKKDFYRAAGVWIVNSKDEVLLAQRKFTKAKDPGKWGPAVAGTVEGGETYESNAYKETEEEIGVSGIKLELGPKQKMSYPRKYFVQWFIGKIDKPAEEFTIQEEEVEQVKWISKEELLKDTKVNPNKYVPAVCQFIDELIKY